MPAFTNINQCFSFTETYSTNLKRLSSADCSEVIIYNNSGAKLLVFDNNNSAAANSFVVPPSGVMTFRGITNSQQVSAQTDVGTGSISYRTQYFSMFPLNIY